MTVQERGWLLLCAELGTEEKPLTAAQLRQLRARVRADEPPREADRDITAADLRALGYDEAQAAHIAALLNREAELAAYLKTARYHDIEALTPGSRDYPAQLRDALGDDLPPVLFCRGDRSLLGKAAVSLTGSRKITEQGRAFAERIGRLAAREGYVLVSGNADGADKAAQEACLRAGGSVIAVLADNMADHRTPPPGVLHLCEEGWHLPFSAQRALRRNRIIYALAQRRFVAQTSCGVGGTWSGAVQALRLGMPVFVHDDGSDGAGALTAQGAEPVALRALDSIARILPAQTAFS